MFFSSAGNSEDFPFSAEDLKKVIGSKEGKQLLALLNQDGGAALQQAAAELQKGNFSGVKTILEPIMRTEEAARLIDQINRK